MPYPHGFIEKLAELSRSGAPFVSVTLVETVGSTPQDAGSKMLVDGCGRIFGTVGGGRVENQAIDHAKIILTQQRGPVELIEWNLQRDIGMTCGGAVKLLFEVYNHRQWRIILFGAGHVAQSLVRVLLELECLITCIDSRREWLEKLPLSPKLIPLLTDNPATSAEQLSGTEFVLSITMGHRTDLPIIAAILRSEFKLPYLGVIGSTAKRKVLIRELIQSGLSLERAEAFRCPIGLDIGTNQPGEIAVSIAAELVQVRRESLASPR